MVRVKAYSLDEQGPLAGFFSALVEGKPDAPDTGLHAFRKRFERPGYSPLENLILAEEGGEIIALLDTVHEEGLARLVLDFKALPQVPRSLLFPGMLDEAEKKAGDRGVRWIHIAVPEVDSDMPRILEENGFRHVRVFKEMRAGLDLAYPDGTGREGVELKGFCPGEEGLLARMQNGIFTGSWGFNPNSGEEIKYYIGATSSRWEDILRLEVQGEEAGYNWTHLLAPTGRLDSEPRGRIHMFGILSPFRNRGLGRILLAAGMKHLKESGASQVELTVDEQNSDALSLYRSRGFQAVANTHWFEKSCVSTGKLNKNGSSCYFFSDDG